MKKNKYGDYPQGVTRPREIAPDVFVEDKQHWAMNSPGGEGLYVVKNDSSGCLFKDKHHGLEVVMRPKVAIYRHYWSSKGRISCFLSYPNGMGCSNDYFWEVYSLEGNLFEDVERFLTETECEKYILSVLK